MYATAEYNNLLGSIAPPRRASWPANRPLGNSDVGGEVTLISMLDSLRFVAERLADLPFAAHLPARRYWPNRCVPFDSSLSGSQFGLMSLSTGHQVA